MRRPILIAALAGTFGLTACQYIPGTNAYQEAKARDTVARTLIDPDSARFRNIESRDEAVCGEVNGKNRMGAYTGYVRFYVTTSNWTATLDPQFDPANLASARSLCSLSHYDSSSCTRQIEEETSQVLQTVFDTQWNVRCGMHRTPQSHIPFDPTHPSGPDDLNRVTENIATSIPVPPDNGTRNANDPPRPPRPSLDTDSLQQTVNDADVDDG
jgi:hypothetical protein